MIAFKSRANTLLLSIAGLIGMSSPALAQPSVKISPSPVFINYTVGATAPDGQPVTLSTTDAGTALVTGASVAYNSGPASGWLTVFPPLGGASNLSVSNGNPATLSLFLANPMTLVAGNYTATVTVTYTGASVASDSFVVFLIVSASNSGGGGVGTETITTDPTSLSFNYSPGGSQPPAQTLTVTVSDGAAFNVTANTNDGNAWLSAAAGSAANTVSVTVIPSNLAAGTYTGTVTLTAPSSVVQVPITLNVGGNGFKATPASITLTLPQNYGFSAPIPVQVTASTVSTVTALVSSDNNWLVLDTPTATTPGVIIVRVNDSSLPQGTYSGNLIVQTSPSNQINIPVSLTVGPPATLQLSPASLTFSFTVGNALPGSQSTTVKSLTSSAQSFTVTSSTTDGAAWLAAVPVSPTPGQVVVTVNPANLTPGTYTGVVTVTPSTAGASPQPITVTLNVVPAPTPVISAIVSSASYAGSAVVPGELVTLFGSTLGPASLVQPTPGTFPKSLGGTSVSFDGIPAPILYASATQTSVQVPYGITIGQTVLTVQRSGSTSKPMQVNSMAALPGFFTIDSSGRGQIAALNENLTLNSPSNPAARGSIIVLYGTGEGATTPAVVEGVITPATTPLPQTTLASSIAFSGAAGTIRYLGETPGATSGLFQLNAVIPANAPTGSAVPVILTINGQASQSGVTVAIQ